MDMNRKEKNMLNFKGDDLELRFKLSRFIYIMLIASIFMYASVAIFVSKTQKFISQPEPTLNITQFRYILYGLSAAMLFIITFTRKLLLSGKGNQNNKNLNSHASRFSSVTIVTGALCESVAIYGLVLYFVGKKITDFYTLMFMSLMYFIYFFPKYPQWNAWVKEYPLARES
jgi:hypothetical protein